MVLAPEHPYVVELVSDENRSKVQQYIEKSQKKVTLTGEILIKIRLESFWVIMLSIQ